MDAYHQKYCMGRSSPLLSMSQSSSEVRDIEHKQQNFNRKLVCPILNTEENLGN